MWYQHDGAPLHNGIPVHEKHLNVTFGQRKSLMPEKTFPSVEDFIARISVAAGRLRDMPGIFQNIRNSMQHPAVRPAR
ncbi:hypothetical protein TNCV_998741 [Trichonephila clavipes]|nr:hypothetical protein TNCV_998741 [Trichonephila clavipes]